MEFNIPSMPFIVLAVYLIIWVIGMGSGLAAVGCNQVFKQFKKFTGETETPDDEDNDRADNEDN